jgi:hypothetical protein
MKKLRGANSIAVIAALRIYYDILHFVPYSVKAIALEN